MIYNGRKESLDLKFNFMHNFGHWHFWQVFKLARDNFPHCCRILPAAPSSTLSPVTINPSSAGQVIRGWVVVSSTGQTANKLKMSGLSGPSLAAEDNCQCPQCPVSRWSLLLRRGDGRVKSRAQWR